MSSAFTEWLQLFEEEKQKLPEVGTVIRCEDVTLLPEVTFIEERDLLCVSLVLSSKMLDDKGQLIKPYWVLVPSAGQTKGTLKAIVIDRMRDLWKQNKEHITITGVKVVSHAHSKKAVLVEFI